jgi:hypothetical protein
LKIGEMDKEMAGPGAVNQYAVFIEEAGGMVAIHNLQHHENLEIYKKCFYIMDKYFPEGESCSQIQYDASAHQLFLQTKRRRPRVPMHQPLTLPVNTHSLQIVSLFF